MNYCVNLNLKHLLGMEIYIIPKQSSELLLTKLI